MAIANDELLRAIELLGIEGHPTSHKLGALSTALSTAGADLVLKKEKQAALSLPYTHLAALRAESPELTAAFAQIPWGPARPPST